MQQYLREVGNFEDPKGKCSGGQGRQMGREGRAIASWEPWCIERAEPQKNVHVANEELGHKLNATLS